MIKLLGKLPEKVTVALSGGLDSMVLLDILKRKHQVTAAFYHHGTATCDAAQKFVVNEMNIRAIPLDIGTISGERPQGQSWEEWWRNCRYQFLDKFPSVVTGHTLDDCVETWIYGSLHGCPKLIPSARNNVVRPLLTTKKTELLDWATKHSVRWYEDASNRDLKFARNCIRHELMPSVLKINPGIHSMIKKKLLARED